MAKNISINRRNMKIKYSTYNLTDRPGFIPGSGIMREPYTQEGNQTEDLKSFCRRYSFAAT